MSVILFTVFCCICWENQNRKVISETGEYFILMTSKERSKGIYEFKFSISYAIASKSFVVDKEILHIFFTSRQIVNGNDQVISAPNTYDFGVELQNKWDIHGSFRTNSGFQTARIEWPTTVDNNHKHEYTSTVK